MKDIFGFIVGLSLILLLFSCDGAININTDDGPDSNKKETQDTVELIDAKTSIMKEPFGIADQKEVYLFTLTNINGITVKITNYGATITSILVPDKNNRMGDIALGYDSLDQYIANSPYFGAMVGRYANRIAKGKFTLNGKSYQLAVNNGKNALHGGLKGFDKVVWDAGKIEDSTQAKLELSYISKDGEEGYPGNLKVKVTYTLDDHNELTTLIEAETDKPTPVNLCNHTYSNLSEADTSVLGHILTMYADQFTQVNQELIPTGELPFVRGTAMDFNNSVAIGERIAKVKGGYDHNYVLQKKAGELAMAAQVYDPRTGRQLEVLTTQPGVQFYTGNFLDGTIKGKGGKVYQKHFGFCLETQHFPDSPNQPAFPNTILKPGEKFIQKTVWRFSVLK
jgi:aldose 1-epimerase